MKMHITIEGDSDKTFRVYHPFKEDITLNAVSLYIALRLIAHANDVKWPIYRLFPKVTDKNTNTIKHVLKKALMFGLGQAQEFNLSIEESERFSKLIDKTNFQGKIKNVLCQKLEKAYDAGKYDDATMYTPYFKLTKETPKFIK